MSDTVITEDELSSAAGPRFAQVEAMLAGHGITVQRNEPSAEPAPAPAPAA